MKNTYRCGECRFFCHEKTFERPCVKLGQIETAKSCVQFKPATQTLNEALQESDGSLELFAKLVRKIPTSSLHTLSAVLYNEKITRKYGYTFLQRVYVRYRGSDGANYVDNFLPCHILEATKAGLRLLSADGKTHILKTDFKKGELSGPNIYSPIEFKKLKALMVKSKKLEDPAHKRKKADFSFLIEEDSSKSKKSKTYTRNDLVTMTRDVEKGYITTGSYKRKANDTDENGHFVIGL